MIELNVARIEETNGAMGPGRVLAVWLQGCRKRCPGCQNGSLLPFRKRQLVAPREVADRLRPGLAGICFSGGEPFLQAKPVTVAARLARARGFAAISYSGYTLEELRDEIVPGSMELLSTLDMLIDGRFVSELAGNYLWRGSSNQKIHLLSDQFSTDLIERAPVTSVAIRNKVAVTIGNPNPALERLVAELATNGIEIGASRKGA